MLTEGKYVEITQKQTNDILTTIREIKAYFQRNKENHSIMRDIMRIEYELITLSTQWSAGLRGACFPKRFYSPKKRLSSVVETSASTKAVPVATWLEFSMPITACILRLAMHPEDTNHVSESLINKFTTLLSMANETIKAVETRAVIYYPLSEKQITGITDIYDAIEKLYTAASETNGPLFEKVHSGLLTLQFVQGTGSSPFRISSDFFREFCVVTQVFSAELKASGTLHHLVYRSIDPNLDITRKQKAASHITHELLMSTLR